MGQSKGGPTVTLEREENVASKSLSLYNYLFNLKLAFLSLFVSFILFIFIDHKYCTLYSIPSMSIPYLPTIINQKAVFFTFYFLQASKAVLPKA